MVPTSTIVLTAALVLFVAAALREKRTLQFMSGGFAALVLWLLLPSLGNLR